MFVLIGMRIGGFDTWGPFWVPHKDANFGFDYGQNSDERTADGSGDEIENLPAPPKKKLRLVPRTRDAIDAMFQEEEERNRGNR